MSSNWQEIVQAANLLALVEHDVPVLRGTFNGRYTREVPCPKCGGVTRFRYRAADSEHPEMVFCSHCAPKGLHVINYAMWLYDMDFPSACSWLSNKPKVNTINIVPVTPPKPINPAIALRYYQLLDTHRVYYRSRGISDEMIERHELGWNPHLQRYSIPCWKRSPQTGELECWNIQYRITPDEEKRMKATGCGYARYLSEKGSSNYLFNADVCGDGVGRMFIVEGRLDALAMTSLGFPTVANPTWKAAWNKYLHAQGVIIIADRDANGVGELKAHDKLLAISHAYVIYPPEPYKDSGEFIMADLATAQRRLTEWFDRESIRQIEHDTVAVAVQLSASATEFSAYQKEVIRI